MIIVDKQNLPFAMKDMGVPAEMSPIKDISNTESRDPFVEVNQPITSQDPLEIRDPSSQTEI